MIFYAPVRGMREIRERGSLAPVVFFAFFVQAAYSFVTDKLSGFGGFVGGGRIVSELFQSAITIVLVAVVMVPVLTLVANAFERRGSFRVVITQEYAPVAATMFYVLTAANVISIVIAVVLHYSGLQDQQVAAMIQNAEQTRAMLPEGPQFDLAAEQLKNPAIVAQSLFLMPKLALFAIGTVVGVKDVFRTSLLRAFAICLVSGAAAVFLLPLAASLFSGVLGSPFLLFLLFLLLRGYFSDIMGTHRAKAAFKQNLESATLNPADASAHYNLGLIHQSRGELDAARERFERALQIDEGEIDASYQLGRIARQQKRYADAIQNFEHVVARDPAHSQYEIWREVAATYIAAGQFEDARNALDQFLEHRPSDPEGLYLMGRAHAGLGHNREANNLMQACIEAVKTAPAYKYRASKRWLNEAQQFIKGSQ
ncbi:MAG: tetratricopeptide repeat protein [Acidobacteria bacterium]|nr:tetratricopeptide repeat protein [Acidobacteriota bacterium]MCA1627206.1 tetratricopeptide repeat protein [Acidobacteriota bacterium]